MPEAPVNAGPARPTDSLRVLVGFPGNVKEIYLKPGSTVSAALEAGSFKFPNDKGWELRLTPLGQHHPTGGRLVDLGDNITEESALLMLHPITGRLPISRIPMTSAQFWTEFIRNLMSNMGVARDMFVILVVWLFLSSILFFIFEGHGYLHALYSTWTTMATLGPLDGAPVSRMGKLVISIDAFAGLILFGGIVWLVTTTLSRR
jgi:hypothetical protein